MDRSLMRSTFLVLLSLAAAGAAEPADRLELDEATRTRCLAELRAGLNLEGDDFWAGMHAAEGLSRAGFGAEVRKALPARLETETDDQRRCGLARELVRAGDLAYVRVLLGVLEKRDPYGHVHACESLFKVREIGDGRSVRRALESDQPRLAIMAAAALTRWGHRGGLERLRQFVRADDAEAARTAGWVLARVGGPADLAALRDGLRRFDDPLTRAYFEHALAALGDAEGRAALVRNLGHADPMVRANAAELAQEARPIGARSVLIARLDDPARDVRIRVADLLLALAGPPRAETPEAFGRDVFVASAEHPRYSEGSVLVRRDGSLLYGTTEFAGSGSDFAAARLVAVDSRDGGRAWSEPRVLQENVGRQNVMSLTLRRLVDPALRDGPIGMFYLVKNSPSDLHVFLRTSTDEGSSWSEPVRVTAEPGYHVLNNDRVTVLSTGRLVVPVASTDDVAHGGRFVSACYLSDDRGRTWRRSRGAVAYARRGAMEPEVLERIGGALLMHFRTQVGHIAVSESTDGGETWGEPRSWEVRAPEAPATLRRIPSTGDLLLVWNDAYRAGAGHGGKRTPLTAAVSSDEGRTWTYRRDLETSDQHTYAYTSLAFHQGRALLTYYVRDEASGRISSRFRSIPIGWFYEEKAGEPR